MRNYSIQRCLLAASPFIAAALASQALDAQAVSDVTQLRTAISDFNAGSTDATIAMAAGTYTLTGSALENANAEGDLDITRSSGSITIEGAGASTTIIDANFVDRVLHVAGSSALTVTLRNVTLRNGSTNDSGAQVTVGARGGGILNDSGATLVLEDVVVEDCTAAGQDGSSSIPSDPGLNAFGGGIFHDSGSLTLLRVAVRDNTAQGGNGGEANLGTGATGGAGGNGEGGGVYIAGGTAVISFSTLDNNSAVGGAGGDGDGGISRGSSGSNGGSGGQGGSGRSGGLFSNATTIQITSSTISSNQAGGGAGGDGGNGGDGFFSGGDGGTGGAAGDGEGGAFSSDSGSITLRNLTLSGNVVSGATGGAGGAGGVGIGSSGFGGDGGDGGSGGQGRGAGISGAGGTLTIQNCTIAGNAASSGAGGVGGAGGAGSSGAGADGTVGAAASSTGRGIYSAGATISIESTILADHGGADVSGTITASASLIEDISEGTILPGATANVTGVDPGLAALADNGGPTLTQAITSGSPAFNTGSNPAGLTSDQRGSGFYRVRDGQADIGAFEVQVGSGGGGGGSKKNDDSDDKCSTGTGGSPAWPAWGIIGGLLLVIRGLWRRRAT